MMATYKVIQDIEAEDKILGPLTLRQFLYAGVAAICLYLTYFVSSRGFAFVGVIFLPVALISGFFAFPWGRDQPTEIWALARIRFILKPRRRIWDQSAIKELVTVTAPKKEPTNYGKNLSQVEVTSRLHALADTLDSRGWAVKNANINMTGQTQQSSDRLVAMSSLAQAPPAELADIRASDDILDELNNPAARQMNSLIEASSKAHRQKIMDSLANEAPAPAAPKQPSNNYWFLNQPSQPASIPNNMVTFNTQVVTPGMAETDLPAAAPGVPTQAEENLVKQLAPKGQDTSMTAYYEHLHKIQPLSAQNAPKPTLTAPVVTQQPVQQPVQAPTQPQPQQEPIHQLMDIPSSFGSAATAAPQPVIEPPTPPPPPPPPQVTPEQQAAILNLANNDDLNVATLAREAERAGPQDEVVIKLH